MPSKLEIRLTNNEPSGDWETFIIGPNGTVIYNGLVTFLYGDADITLTANVGDIVHGHLLPSLSQGNDTAAFKGATIAADTDNLYLWLQTGQSLSTGVTDPSNDPVNITNLANAYRYTGMQPYSLGDNVGDSTSVATLSSYKESNRETNGYAAMKLIMEILSDDGTWLWANHGKGGASLASLSPPSVMFNNGALQIGAVTERATELLKTPVIPFLMWIQGESNQSTSREDYITGLRSLHDEYITLASNETGQTSLPMMLEQSGNNSAHDIAKTFFEYTRRYEDAYLVGPKYFLNRLYYSTTADRTHLNADGYQIQGEYEAIAGAKLIQNGESKCLEPLSFAVVGNTIEITLNVPTLPIVIDTTIMPAAPGYGLKYIRPSGGGDVIPTVTISGSKLVLDIGEAPAINGVIDAGETLSDSANTGGSQFSCTNIRDSSARASIVSGWTLHHWLVEFDHTLTAEDGATEPAVGVDVYLGNDPVVFTGSEGSSTVSGGGTGFDNTLITGDYRIQFDYAGGNANTGRYRIGEKFLNFTGDSGSVDSTVTVTDVSVPRNGFYGFNGWAGTVSNISITRI